MHDNWKLFGVGILAFVLGLKHALDVDHIVAIDNVTRKLMADQKQPLGVGFYFSLGHSTAVFLMAVILIAFSKLGLRYFNLGYLKHWGMIWGTLISASFLFLIALMNVRVIQKLRTIDIQQEKSFDHIIPEGFLSRGFNKIYTKISKSSQMYFIGILFGLGFDTTTELVLMAITVSVDMKNNSGWMALTLLLLFSSGMILIDSTDGIAMASMYNWAFANPIKKYYYNFAMTGISILFAVMVGTLEIFQVIAVKCGFHQIIGQQLLQVSFSKLGMISIAFFAFIWVFFIGIVYKRNPKQKAVY